MAWFGIFGCNPDPDRDFLCRCRFWSGWTQIYLTYCNVPLLGLIYPKVPLFGIFCCNTDLDPDFWSRCRFWSGWTQIYPMYCNVPLLGLIALKCHYLAYFAVIRIQIRFFFHPDEDFDQDGPSYWPLFAVKWHYLGYFAVIWIHICIFDPILIRMNPDIPNLL